MTTLCLWPAWLIKLIPLPGLHPTMQRITAIALAFCLPPQSPLLELLPTLD